MCVHLPTQFCGSNPGFAHTGSSSRYLLVLTHLKVSPYLTCLTFHLIYSEPIVSFMDFLHLLWVPRHVGKGMLKRKRRDGFKMGLGGE